MEWYGVVTPTRLAFEKCWLFHRKQDETFDQFMTQLNFKPNRTFEENIRATLINRTFFKLSWSNISLPIQQQIGIRLFEDYKHTFVGYFSDDNPIDMDYANKELKKYDLYQYGPRIWRGNFRDFEASHLLPK